MPKKTKMTFSESKRYHESLSYKNQGIMSFTNLFRESYHGDIYKTMEKKKRYPTKQEREMFKKRAEDYAKLYS